MKEHILFNKSVWIILSYNHVAEQLSIAQIMDRLNYHFYSNISTMLKALIDEDYIKRIHIARRSYYILTEKGITFNRKLKGLI